MISVTAVKIQAVIRGSNKSRYLVGTNSAKSLIFNDRRKMRPPVNELLITYKRENSEDKA